MPKKLGIFYEEIWVHLGQAAVQRQCKRPRSHETLSSYTHQLL